MYFLELVLLLATILIQKECFAGDGSLELRDGPNQITEYYAKDQCMAQPGYFHLHHFSFAFFLQKHQICGGGPDGLDGLLICYRSQLEKSALLPMGIQPTRQYELRNVAGNGVAERCEELAGPNWHGLLINTNDQRNFVLHFSTTNRTFIIDGGMEKLEQLIYKLASAKDVGESFLSKTFGPYRDFMKWNNDHFGKAEEADNRIRHEDNEKLKKLFMERQAMQERLQNYAGIWSLGLDMLPTKEGNDHFVLYVNKSECCDILAFFNQPTAQKPEQTGSKVNFTNRPIRQAISIAENLKITLTGIINPDANEYIFEIIDDPVDVKSNGMRFIVNFGENSIIFKQKIKDNGWIDLDVIPTVQNHFARGASFLLEVILRKNGMIVNVNCNGPVPIYLDAGKEIAFENPHFINITGDFEYFGNVNFSDVSASLKYWILDGALHAQNSGGIMLQGKIDEDAKKFTIKLWHQKQDGSYDSILQLEVGIKEQNYKLSIGSKNEDCQKLDGTNPDKTFKKCDMKEMANSHNAGSEFEAICKFILYPDVHQISIWLDNLLIANLYIEPAYANVHFIQIDGDATAKMTKIRKNHVKCDYEMSPKNGKKLRIVGKMLPDDGEADQIPDLSSAFKVQLKNGQGFVQIQLYLNFAENNLQIIEGIGENPVQILNSKLSIKLGEIFHLNMHYKSQSQIGVIVNNEPEIVFVAKNLFSETIWVEIHGDLDAFIIMEMDMTNCINA